MIAWIAKVKSASNNDIIFCFCYHNAGVADSFIANLNYSYYFYNDLYSIHTYDHQGHEHKGRIVLDCNHVHYYNNGALSGNYVHSKCKVYFLMILIDITCTHCTLQVCVCILQTVLHLLTSL